MLLSPDWGRNLKYNTWSRAVFFFPRQFSVCPWHLMKKDPRICVKCPWQKTLNLARENWPVARDKIAKKMPVKNEKCPWQFLQVCPWYNKKCPWQTIVFLSDFFINQLKLTFFFLTFVFFFRKRGKKTTSFLFTRKSSYAIHSRYGGVSTIL